MWEHDAIPRECRGVSLFRSDNISLLSTLAVPSTVDELATRLARLMPESSRRWGRMSAHEMLCHLADSFRGMLGESYVSPAPGGRIKRSLMRFIALHTALPWPKGIPTRPEVDPLRQGTRPRHFEHDRDAVLALMRRFVSEDATYAEHPMFGRMSRRDWMIWGYRHMDHHLRQFGV